MGQRIKGSMTEEVVLQRAFKYFDSLGNGKVNFESFIKALERIGIYENRQVGPAIFFI